MQRFTFIYLRFKTDRWSETFTCLAPDEDAARAQLRAKQPMATVIAVAAAAP